MPRSRSMVRRVIAISGSPLADWAAINDKFRAMNTSLVYGERIGCTIDSSWKLVDCIRRGRSFAELTNIEFKPEIGTWPWAPVIQVCLLFSNLNFCLNHKPLPIVKIFLSICVIEALLLPPRSGIYLPCVYTYESFQLQKT